MYEDNNPNQLDYESNIGMSYGMYVGDAPVTTGDPFATYQQLPTSLMFYSGIQESRM